MNSLRHLANLSQQLSQHRESKSYIREALFKVKELLLFDFCVLYEVRNVVQDQIILEVIQNIGNDSARPDLFERKKICLSLENPDPKFTNEVYSYLNLRTSNVPVSGRGSDIAGYFQTPQEWGHGFILSCDYVHGNHEVKDEDFYTFEIVCNMLMGALTRNFYAHLATHDTLTGCLNKKMIYDQLDRALYKCARSVDSWLSVAMIDIDHFKKINDNYGHLQGDSILEEFVKIIEKSIRSRSDCLGRYGGEEFLLILEGTSPQSAHYVLERLRKNIHNHKFSQLENDDSGNSEKFLQISASMGLMSIHSRQSEIQREKIIDSADQALYVSKNNGRNQISIADNYEI